MRDLGGRRVVTTDLSKRTLERESLTEERAVRFFERRDLVGLKSPAFETNQVYAIEMGSVTIGGTIGGDVKRHHRSGTNICRLADTGKLMYADQRPDSDIIFERDMPAQIDAVR